MGQAVLINLVSSVAAFFFGLAARGIYKRWTEVRPARKVWRIDRTVEVSIVTSDGPDRGNKDVRVTWEADALAATAVAHHLGHAQGIAAPRATSFKSFLQERDLGNNLVVIGGPSKNDLYRQMAERLDVPYTFDLSSGHAKIVRKSDKRTFPQDVRGGRTIVDYAVITLAGNPVRPTSRLVMLAGCGATGTLAAAELVTSGRVREVAKIVNSKDFVSIVIQVELIHGYMTEPRIVAKTHWRDVRISDDEKAAADYIATDRAAQYIELLGEAELARRSGIDYSEMYGEVDVCPVCGIESLVVEGKDGVIDEVPFGQCVVCSYERPPDVADIRAKELDLRRKIERSD
jgi:hypothetical protein